MKTQFLILLIVFSASNIFAQTESLTIQQNILKLEDQLVKQQKELDKYYKELDKEYRNYKIIKEQFNDKYNSQNNMIDSLQQIINKNSANIKRTASELGVKIEDSHKSTNQSITDLNKALSELEVKIEDTHKFSNQSVTDLNKALNENTLYWIIAILVVALFVLLVFVLLRKQIFKHKTDLDSNLQDTRKVLEEEGVKLDNKLVEVLETQLKIINSSNSGTEKEADHTLALKVADEIIRIQKNLTRMDEKTKGLKQLTASVKRIQDNFASNGYEIVEMLGKPFNDGMKVSANFVPDEDLEAGQQIISRIIKPQVNYKGVMIQSAQIEVSQG